MNKTIYLTDEYEDLLNEIIKKDSKFIFSRLVQDAIRDEHSRVIQDIPYLEKKNQELEADIKANEKKISDLKKVKDKLENNKKIMEKRLHIIQYHKIIFEEYNVKDKNEAKELTDEFCSSENHNLASFMKEKGYKKSSEEERYSKAIKL